MVLWFSIWKICVPKERVHKLVEELDEDGDGYISLGECRNVLRSYGKAVKRDGRYLLQKKEE